MPVPPMLKLLNTPVSNAPMIPPTPCTPNTSSASSAPSSFFRPVTPQKQATPASAPIARPPPMPTQPQAGVMARRPALGPGTTPSRLGFPLISHSANIQDSAAAAVAIRLLAKARVAVPPDSSAEPALKPNQPTHSREAPIMV